MIFQIDAPSGLEIILVESRTPPAQQVRVDNHDPGAGRVCRNRYRDAVADIDLGLRATPGEKKVENTVPVAQRAGPVESAMANATSAVISPATDPIAIFRKRPESI